MLLNLLESELPNDNFLNTFDVCVTMNNIITVYEINILQEANHKCLCAEHTTFLSIFLLIIRLLSENHTLYCILEFAQKFISPIYTNCGLKLYNVVHLNFALLYTCIL